MKPTGPFRNKSRVFATPPCRGLISFSLDVVSAVRILRLIGCMVFTVIGVVLLLRPLSAIPNLSHLPAYQLGGLAGSLLMAFLAFALAWRCVKTRS
jgi:hypothetical protein